MTGEVLSYVWSDPKAMTIEKDPVSGLPVTTIKKYKPPLTIEPIPSDVSLSEWLAKQKRATEL